MTLLRFNGVSVRFDAQPVLRDVHFRLAAGERVGLIGKNGVGKTTVLRLILGLEEPAKGAIETPRELRIGYFSQFSELHGERSVEERLDDLFSAVHAVESELTAIAKTIDSSPSENELTAALTRQAELLAEMERRDGWNVRNRIDTVLSRLGFSDADRVRPADALSGGWQNRAALVEILLQDPEVLLLDEPTAGLPEDLTERVMELIRQKAAEGMSVVIVEHDLTVIWGLSDLVHFMAEGSVILQGDPASIREHETVVEKYLGSGHVGG